MSRSRKHQTARRSAALIASSCAILCCLLFRTSGPARAAAASSEPLTYASPVELLYSPNGTRLYVLCQGTDEVRILNASTYAPIASIPVGHIPRGMSLSADGSHLYVANTWDDTVSNIDIAASAVVSTWHVGSEPSSVVPDRTGKVLFVANRISNDIAVLDAATGKEEKRLAAGRGASYITPAPDGSRLYVTHVYPNPARQPTPDGNRLPPQSEITVIDAGAARVATRIPLPLIAHSFHLAFSPDGRLGVVANLHPRNLVPLAHMEHGAAFTDALTLFGPDIGPSPVEVPLDELERYASRPFGVAVSPDKSRIFVTCEGAESLLVLSVPSLLQFVHTHPGPYAQDLSASAHYVIAHVDVGRDPRGITLAPNGKHLLVANRLDDTLSVIDLSTNRPVNTVSLESPKRLSILRQGEQAFYTSRYSFQRQMGCANCHIDSTFDGLTWDLEPDGFGRDIVDNRPIEDLVGTEPYKWNGGNPNLPTECGPRTEKYFWRSENYDDLTLTHLVSYVRSLPPRPNRWRESGDLTPAQERGKAIFERSTDKFGKAIPEANRCVTCHSGPKGTSQKSFDVGTRKPTDNSGLLDTPQLVNIAITAPYLHDGSARSLEEIWTIFNPEDRHGRTNDLTKDELNDLIEYLRTR